MSIRLRLIAWYVTVIGAVSMAPFYGVILADMGLLPSQVAACLALIPVGTLLGGPVWAFVADRSGSPKGVLVLSAALASVMCTLLLVAPTGLVFAASLLLFALARSPLVSIGDAMVLRVLPGGPSTYGSIRLWGSVAYLVGAWTNGFLREVWPRGPLFLGWTLMVGTAIAARALPEPPSGPRPPLRQSLAALRARPLLVPLVAVGVLHGIGVTTYDNLYSLHIEGLDLPSRVIGQAVAVGVGAEIALMALSRRVHARITPQALLVIAVAAGIPRWWLVGTVESEWAQVAVQVLHGLSFGAYWIAGVALYNEAAPHGLESSTQALLPVSTFGVGYVLSMSAAAVALRFTDPATLFRALSATSLLATLLALGVAMGWSHTKR